jgi:hypothetical protein
MSTCPVEMRGVTPIPETGPTWDERLPDQRKILAVQWVKLPRYWREGAVEVRPFTAETRLRVSLAQGLSGEAVMGNPPTTVIPGVDESKITPEESSEPLVIRDSRVNLPTVLVLWILPSWATPTPRLWG